MFLSVLDHSAPGVLFVVSVGLVALAIGAWAWGRGRKVGGVVRGVAAVGLVMGLGVAVTAVTRLVPRAQVVVIDAHQPDRVFEGIGACSAGASSRLLPDYPEPHRSAVLDLLFTPYHGAAFQHLKVEIGGDVNSTDGCEPSHQRSPEDLDFQRGWEWWLMKEARERNPEIILDALAWGAPGWIGGGEFFSDDMSRYLIRFLRGARDVHGLELQHIGLWNEVGAPGAWIKGFRSALNEAGLGQTRIVAPDLPRTWWFVDQMIEDRELLDAVDVVGVHYPGGWSSPEARALGKPLWSSEDGPWDGSWLGARDIARRLNRNYVEGRMTKTILWSPVTAYYDVLPLPGSGVMRANTPWSGHYEVQPALWAVAHTTQFARPGWRYLGGKGCGLLLRGGSYVSMLSPGGDAFSLVVETMGSRVPQAVGLKVKHLEDAPLHIWRSSAAEQFTYQGTVEPVAGRASFVFEPECIYSVTTTTGQAKTATVSPPATPLALPVERDFEQERVGGLSPWFADQAGAFEVQPRDDGRGNALRQVLRQKGIEWPWHRDPFPETVMGEVFWRDYTVSVDARAVGRGRVALHGRITEVPFTDAPPRGYCLWLQSEGDWELLSSTNLLDRGRVESVREWNRLSLEFYGGRVRAVINGERVAEAEDPAGSGGLIGLGSGWHEAEFDNLSIQLPEGSGPVL